MENVIHVKCMAFYRYMYTTRGRPRDDFDGISYRRGVTQNRLNLDSNVILYYTKMSHIKSGVSITPQIQRKCIWALFISGDISKFISSVSMNEERLRKYFNMKLFNMRWHETWPDIYSICFYTTKWKTQHELRMLKWTDHLWYRFYITYLYSKVRMQLACKARIHDNNLWSSSFHQLARHNA